MKQSIGHVLGLQGWIIDRLEQNEYQVDVVAGRSKKEARCPHGQAISRLNSQLFVKVAA